MVQDPYIFFSISVCCGYGAVEDSGETDLHFDIPMPLSEFEPAKPVNKMVCILNTHRPVQINKRIRKRVWKYQ